MGCFRSLFYSFLHLFGEQATSDNSHLCSSQTRKSSTCAVIYLLWWHCHTGDFWATYSTDLFGIRWPRPCAWCSFNCIYSGRKESAWTRCQAGSRRWVWPFSFKRNSWAGVRLGGEVSRSPWGQGCKNLSLSKVSVSTETANLPSHFFHPLLSSLPAPPCSLGIWCIVAS